MTRRTGALQDGKPVSVRAGDDFLFMNDYSVVGGSTKVATSYTKKLLKVGDQLFVDDGLLSFTVEERLPEAVRTIAGKLRLPWRAQRDQLPSAYH
ncbi:hypothetical protein BJ742DRAFT_820983 [Cladochytrium replicatum]|nr:hypothetical protein BJ742DRAFT_820983 [Cladochytrium replicatum]